MIWTEALTRHFLLAGDSGLPTHEIRKLGSILTVARVPKLVVTTTSIHLKQPCAYFKVTRFHNQGLISEIEVWTKQSQKCLFEIWWWKPNSCVLSPVDIIITPLQTWSLLISILKIRNDLLHITLKLRWQAVIKWPGRKPRSLSQLGYRNWWEDVESMCQVDTWRIAPLGKFIIVLTNPG
jgi:hypothetical protein